MSREGDCWGCGCQQRNLLVVGEPNPDKVSVVSGWRALATGRVFPFAGKVRYKGGSTALEHIF